MAQSPIFEQRLTSYPQAIDGRGILTAETLSWNEGQQQLALENVVGTSLVSQGEEAIPCLLVYAYPKISTGIFNKKYRRTLQEHCFSFEDLSLGQQWQRAIDNTLQGQPIDAAIKPRTLQIIINPISGQKKAAAIFAEIEPLLAHSNLQYTVTQTTSSRNTQELAQHLDLEQVDGLVIVGGDGTIHDAIAGLMSRVDWEQAIKLPLGIIPGGSANGLCKTLLELSAESYDPLNAAFLVVKGKQQRFDLAQVKQNNAKYYSFLSLSWGLVSDADIESEKLKFLGALRFDLYALWLLSQLRIYKGRFSFLPHPERRLSNLNQIEQQGQWYVIEDEFIFLWGMNTAWAAYDMNVTPHAQINDGAMDILIMRKGTSRLELLQALLRCGRGAHLNLPHLEYYKVQAFRLEPLTDKGILVVDGEPVDYSPIEMKVMPQLACVNC